DVEEQERPGRRGFRSTAVEQLPQPFWVDELVVLRKPIDRHALIGCPRGPTILIASDALEPQLLEPGLDCRDVLGPVAVQNDLTAGDDALRLEQRLKVR